MQLIQDLIDTLSKSGSPIEHALIQAQVLAHRLGDKDMAAWVAAELNGYADQNTVPPYREIGVQIIGNLTNDFWWHNEQPILLAGLKPQVRAAMTVRKIVQGVGAIQHWAVHEAEGKPLSVTLSAERCILLSKAYDEGWYVHSAWAAPGLGGFRQILTQIRSRLLTFALNLQDQVSTNATAQDIKTQLGPSAVNDMFRGAVFGDNTTVIVGDNNSVRGVTNSVVRNDFASLADALQKLGVQEGDIEGLRGAIAEDEGAPEHAEQGFGQKVRTWIGGMVAKAGTKACETAAATGVTALYAFLKAYYGWS